MYIVISVPLQVCHLGIYKKEKQRYIFQFLVSDPSRYKSTLWIGKIDQKWQSISFWIFGYIHLSKYFHTYMEASQRLVQKQKAVSHALLAILLKSFVTVWFWIRSRRRRRGEIGVGRSARQRHLRLGRLHWNGNQNDAKSVGRRKRWDLQDTFLDKLL